MKKSSRWTSILVAAGVAALIAAWFTFGGALLNSSNPPDAVAANADGTSAEDSKSSFQQEQKPFPVLVRQFEAQDSAFEVEFFARSRPSSAVVIKSELEASIVEVLVEEGSVVKKGDVILKFSEDERKAALARAQSAYNAALANYEASKSVAEKGYETKINALNREQELRNAEQALIVAKKNAANLILKAPASGLLSARFVDLGSNVRVGDQIARVDVYDPLEVSFFVSETQYADVSVGYSVRIVTVSGQEAQGKVTYVSPTGDNKTGTYEVRAQFSNADGRIPFGMSGTAYVAVSGSNAHLVPHAAFTLDEKGSLIVRGVNPDNTVVNYSIAIVRESDGPAAWVSGLPRSVMLITAGQDFVLEGQKVLTELDEGTPS